MGTRLAARTPIAAAAVAAAAALVLTGCRAGPSTADLAAGERVPADVALPRVDLAGEPLDLDAALARGEPVAFVFWQTWCASCRAEAPAVARAAATHGERLRFVGVVPGRDDAVDVAEVEATRAAWGYDLPQVRDRDLALSRALGVRGTPTIVVLGPDREVRYHAHRPPADWAALAE